MAQSNLVGRTLGQYTVMEQLGRGGMADVYKAFHPQLELHRAIKVIRPEFVTASDFRARFQKEAQAVAGLRHPNIVQIHDFGEQDDAYYMVMEFIQGRDLKHVIQEEGKIRPIRRAVEVVDQVAGALHYAHSQGLIHRDIKPENIMISDDGLPILMDFGIAKLLTSSTQLTQTGLGIGTPAYMAPEQAKALPEIGPAADIYSLTVVLFEMLTGRVPYSADTPMAVMLKAINDPMPLPRAISSDIGESLQQVLMKGSAKEAGDRYATAKQFQDALHHALEDEAPTAEPAATEILRTQPTSAQEGESRPRQNVRAPKYGIYTLAVLLLAAAVGAGLYLVMRSDPGQVAEAPSEPKAQDATSESKAVEAEPEPASPEPASQDTEKPGPQTDESVKLVAEKTSTKAGQALEFAVDASQGDVVYLQVYDTSETTDFTLITPDGRSEVFKTYGDHGPATLEQDGQYTLRAMTRNDKSAQIDMVLWRLNPAVIDDGALQLGKYIQGKTSVPGQAVSYTLAAETGQTLFFDLTESSNTTDFTLTAPDGREEVFKSYGDHGPMTLDQSGTYRLLADPRGDKTSTFDFAVWHVDPAVVDGGALQTNQYIQGNTSVAGQVVSYTLDAENEQTLFFDLEKSSETTDFTLLAPDGRTEVFRSYGDQGPLTLEQAGTYKLSADPRGDKTSEFEFAVWHVDPAVVDSGALQPGQHVEGETSVAGQSVSYTLEAQAEDTLYFDLNTSSNTTDFTLISPDGRTEVFRSYGDAGPLTLEQTGTHRLLADPRGDNISEFGFTLWLVDPAVVDGGSLQFGQFTQGETTVPGQTVTYTLEAQSGQTLYFELAESSTTTDFTLTAPDGKTEVFRSYGDHGPVSLEQEGLYTLLADPRGDKTAKFEFMVRPEK